MKVIDYLEKYDSVKRYKNRLAQSTWKNCAYNLHYFFEWVKDNGEKFASFDPDQLVDYQKNASNSERFEILDILQDWILNSEGRHSTKKNKYNVIRGWFKSNRAELPRDDFNVRGDIPRVRGKLSVEDIKKLVLSSKTVFQAIWLCMIQGGMGQDELIYWSNHGIKKLLIDMKQNPEIIRIDLPGRKNKKFERPYFTFIGIDALEALRKWLGERPRDANAIFTNQFGDPITKKALYMYWSRHLFSLGLIEKNDVAGPSTRYGMNLHEIRDVFRSQWEKSPVKGSVAEFLMGHVVDPLEYNKAFRDEKWVRREYLKALPYLQIMSSPRPFGQVDEDEVERLQREIQELKIGREDRIQELESKVEDLTEAIKLIYTDPELVDKLRRR